MIAFYCFICVFPLINVALFGTDSKFLDWNNFEQQIRNYEIVAPRLQIQGLWRREISTRSSLVSGPIFILLLIDFAALQ